MPPFETLDAEQVARLKAAGWADEKITALDRARARQASAVRPTGGTLPDVASAEQLEEQRPGAGGSPVLAGVNAALLNQLPRILDLVGQKEMAQKVQGSVERAFEEQPGAAGLAAAAGMLIPSAGTIPMLARGARGAAGLAGRAITRAAGGRAPVATELLRRGAQAGTEAAVGAAGGAVEGGIAGAGAAFGESPEEQIEQGILGALTGAAAGGGAFGLTGAARALTKFDEPLERAGRIQRDVERRSGLPSRVRTDAQRREITAARRQAFREIEESTPTLPDEVSQLIQEDPALRRVLNRVARGSEEGRAIVQNMNEIEQATRAMTQSPMFGEVPFQQLISRSEIPERQPIPFKLAQNIEQEANRLAKAHARGDMRVPGGALAVEEAGEAVGRLRDALVRSVPGYDEAIRLTAREKAAANAFRRGEEAFTAPPERAQAFLQREGRELGTTGREVRGLGASGEEGELFRAGMAAKLVDRVREGGSIREINKALSAPAEQERLRIILGSDEAVQGFLRGLQQERARLTAGKIVENLVKFGGFVWLGSSLAGNTILAGTR